jgi:hypothetical protein
MVTSLWRPFEVVITHEPTGETVCVGGDTVRTQREALKKAEKIMRSRLWAAQNGLKRPDLEAVIAEYDLPDDVEYPNDLGDYRKPSNTLLNGE